MSYGFTEMLYNVLFIFKKQHYKVKYVIVYWKQESIASTAVATVGAKGIYNVLKCTDIKTLSY